MKVLSRASHCLLPLAFLTACSVGPKYHAPQTAVDAHFSNGKQPAYSPDVTIAKWWRRFDDTQLNNLVDKALVNNRDLAIAAARVDETNAIFRAIRYDLFPIVTSGASYTYEHEAKVNRLPGSSGNVKLLDFGLNETWEVDLWGRVRNSVKAAKADWETADEQRNDTMVSLTSSLASAYLELRGLQHQLDVAQKNVDNENQTLELTQKLLQGGRGTELDTSRALAQLKQTEAAIPPIQSAISKDIHAISVLIGEQPQSLEASLGKSRPIPALPSSLHIGRPADLLRRRPDIRAAERSLEAYSLRVNVATADLFPKVGFNSTLDAEAANFGKLFHGPGILQTSFGPQVTWPAFALGQVKAQVDAAGARARGQLATYQKTVLVALQETEDALNDYGRQRARTSLLREASDASQKAAKLATDRFTQGAADFLTVLDAERTLLEAETTLAQSETSQATAVVTIYKALGGGWEGTGVDTKPVVQ